MMFFSDGKYPRSAGYLRTKIIGMNSESKIFKVLVECVEDESLVRQALSPGTYPRLIIGNLVSGMFLINGAYNGDCVPETKNYIYVHTRITRSYENIPEQSPLLFERTVLHEVVHWGRFMGGKSTEIEGKEAGSWFEHLAYDIVYNHRSGFQCPNK
jgi:hypothetical protein